MPRRILICLVERIDLLRARLLNYDCLARWIGRADALWRPWMTCFKGGRYETEFTDSLVGMNDDHTNETLVFVASCIKVQSGLRERDVRAVLGRT